ncbi:DUF397 domain-containing protein [Thermopolyspora sp. NPDC052614]|uniref:DUF397 domain-containing protein n=1 Tax=Thermopolyspora sp. NPDC052614 TaxID=3155682 RepID=UPI00341E1E22
MGEVGLPWRKSSYSSGNGENCLEVSSAMKPSVIAVRDSKNPDAAVLEFSVAEWRDFLAAVKNGRHGTGPVRVGSS